MKAPTDSLIEGLRGLGFLIPSEAFLGLYGSCISFGSLSIFPSFLSLKARRAFSDAMRRSSFFFPALGDDIFTAPSFLWQSHFSRDFDSEGRMGITISEGGMISFE